MPKKTNLIDRILGELQHGLNTCHLHAPAHQRAYPAESMQIPKLNPQEQQQVAGLMRVNHAGEVAAQGLYRGQAFTARDSSLQQAMTAAAEEENEHLNWCQRRLAELHASRSQLDGFWYWGSFSIGALAGLISDRHSLGFVEETERQVHQHLHKHLLQLPEADLSSRAILKSMAVDEMRHAQNAHKAGARILPGVVKKAMRGASKLMTLSAYRI